ncbi:hypothetical protein BSO21_33815, partial [Paenibacillus odorifer]
FRETYASVADSMMYAYKEVGDRQQDLFDTFWEYSGYFKNTGANSGQMANFLTQSVKEGSFNFDKPADFIKETFGVKALDAGDMEKYFALRGAGKAEAAKQAVSFTGDINSGEEQRTKGALMALVADLASQSQSELKASLVSLGSATAEDNGSAVLKTFQVPFQPAPSGIAGTTERMVKAQQDANPMQDIIQTRAEIDQQMQELGANLSTAVLPVLKEFNALITENKEQIQTFGSGIVKVVTTATDLYGKFFDEINVGVGLLIGTFAANKVYKGYQKSKDVASDIRGLFGRRSTSSDSLPIEEVGSSSRKRFTLRRGTTAGLNGGLGGGLKSISSMTVNASVVYLNESGGLGGSIGGQGSRSGGRPTRRGRTGRSSSNTRTITGGSGGTGSIRARRGTRTTNIPDIDAIPDVAGRRGRVTYRNTARLRGTSAVPDIISDVSDIPARRGLLKGFAKGGTKAVKALGIAGTVAGIGMTGYDLYQASRDDGFKAGVSSTGGSLVGGTAGGILGGVVGSLAGPIGTAVGAAAGGWVGDKLGSLADSSGVTKSVV